MKQLTATIDQTSRRLVEDVARSGAKPLLLLPSTPAAFSLIDQCIQRGLPVEAVGHAWSMKAWAPELDATVCSPLALWRRVKDAPALPFAVAVFQDQLVSVDDSYHQAAMDGQTCHVSPIEVMLLMRFKPPVYIGTPQPGSRAGEPSTLSLDARAAAVPPAMSRAAFDALLAEFLQPVAACQDAAIGDWRARDGFRLKLADNFDRMLSQRLQEIEALVRVYHDRHDPQTSFANLLASLRTSRLSLASGLR